MPPHSVLRPLTRPHRRYPNTLQTLYVRGLAQDATPKKKILRTLPQTPEPEDHRRSWFWMANRISNLVVIPSAILYCIFFADYGEGEHVFSPARRWLHRQRDAFFSLTAEQRQLVHEDKAHPSKQDSQ